MSERVIRTYAERMAGYRRVLEARSTATSAARLRELAADGIRPVRLWTARNRDAPPDVLHLLAGDPDSTVRWNVLLNPSTAAHTHVGSPRSTGRPAADVRRAEPESADQLPWPQRVRGAVLRFRGLAEPRDRLW